MTNITFDVNYTLEKIDKKFPEREFLLVEDLAEYLEVAPRTVRDLISRKQLFAFRIGREYRIPIDGFKKFMVESST